MNQMHYGRRARAAFDHARARTLCSVRIQVLHGIAAMQLSLLQRAAIGSKFKVLD